MENENLRSNGNEGGKGGCFAVGVFFFMIGFESYLLSLVLLVKKTHRGLRFDDASEIGEKIQIEQQIFGTQNFEPQIWDKTLLLISSPAA